MSHMSSTSLKLHDEVATPSVILTLEKKSVAT